MTHADNTSIWTQPDSDTFAADPDTPVDVDAPVRPLLLTPDEAGALVRRTGGWMRRKAAAGQIPCTVLGRTILFSRTDLGDLVVMHHRPAVG